MTELALLPTVAATEAAILVGLVAFLVAHRWYANRSRARLDRERRRVMEALGGWLLGTRTERELARALHAERQSSTIRQLTLAIASHVPPDQRETLSEILRQPEWQHTIHRDSKSFWWRRLRAAQMLTLTARNEDTATLARLIEDRHPTVQTVAVRALLRVPNRELIAHVIDRLPQQPAILRAIQGETLQHLWPMALPLIVERLKRSNVPSESLEAWITFADMLGAPLAFDALMALATHSEANIRVVVTRALRHCYQPVAAETLATLLRDPDWRVRGQAARGLGALSVHTAIPQLRTALSDPSWWVRFRAGLALAQMREPGRQALREARALPDRFASEMAIMISGLSDGSITELTEA